MQKKIKSSNKTKTHNTPKIFTKLEVLASLVPAAFYWTDKEAVIKGCNLHCPIIIGSPPYKSYIGKSPYDMYPTETAKVVYENTKKVMETGEMLTFEESVADITTGKNRYYTVTRSPLFEDGKVVGTVGVTVEVTAEKEAERLKFENKLQKSQLQEQEKFKKIVNQIASDIESPLAIISILSQYCAGMPAKKTFENIKQFASVVPIPLCWLDTEGVFLGGNDLSLRVTGAKSFDKIVGKKCNEFYSLDIAEAIVKNIQQTINTRKTVEAVEVTQDFVTGKKRFFKAIRSPLFDENNVIIGVIDTSIEITAEKEAERLKLENELQKIQLEQAEKIHIITGQVVHDISSPLASLQVIANRKDIEEEIRTTIRGASNRINDIVNNLSIRYGTIKNKEDKSAAATTSPELIFCLIDSILSEKRVQYMGCNVNFNLDVADNARGLFAKVNAEKFKRLISNIINNSIEAIVKVEPNRGYVDVSLQKSPYTLNIQIKDNGCGIPKAILDKIGLNKISTKEGGNHGIGLFTAIAQLKEWNCQYQINSQANVGTIFSIDMPLCKTPNWFQKKLALTSNSKIVVLDDDQSIHDVWDSRFKELNQAITIKHFYNPDKLLKQRLQSNNILYLIDYELLGAEYTGLDIIRKLKLKNQAILVTSRYEDKNIKADCSKLQLKIIPKNFAPYIPLCIKEK